MYKIHTGCRDAHSPRALDNTLENPDDLLQKCALGLLRPFQKPLPGRPGRNAMRTKIVATIGPASNSKRKLKALAKGGRQRVPALNFPAALPDFVNIIKYIREVYTCWGDPITIAGIFPAPKSAWAWCRKTPSNRQGVRLLLGPQRPARGRTAPPAL